MIAHRLKTVRNVDQILVLDNAHIVQRGTHAELIQQKGSPTYAMEILDPWFSYGLDALLREKQYKLCGIPVSYTHLGKAGEKDRPQGKG